MHYFTLNFTNLPILNWNQIAFSKLDRRNQDSTVLFSSLPLSQKREQIYPIKDLAYFYCVLSSFWSLWHCWLGFQHCFSCILITRWTVVPWLVSTSFFSVALWWAWWWFRIKAVWHTILPLLFFSFLLLFQLIKTCEESVFVRDK